MPYFHTFADFIHMGGHGLFVWTCWAIVVIVFAMMIASSIRTRKQLLKKLEHDIALRESRSRRRI